MNFPTDASNLLDVFDHLIVILGAIVLAAVPSWLSMRNHKGIQEVKDQVKNGHTKTNLRDDIDRAIAAVELLGHDVRGIRTDLAAEEDRRRAQVAELEHRLTQVSRRHQ